jgi:hypothetical protein
MARANSMKRHSYEKSESREAIFKLRADGNPTELAESRIHVLGPGIICDTEPRGHQTPHGKSLVELLVDSSEGFIPLWAPDVTLHWRFRESSMQNFSNPETAKEQIRNLLGEALLAWGNAAPIAFTEDIDLWDFEIVMRTGDNCTPSGCVLASSFFPDAGRHQLFLYPQMFVQSPKEQVDTLVHEIGHVFGLRHFFARISEKAWPSEIFGTHSKFSIMNYGELSELTDVDRDDLRRLYQSVWDGSLVQINGTPIQQFVPYHTRPVAPVAIGPIAVAPGRQSRVAYRLGVGRLPVAAA